MSETHRRVTQKTIAEMTGLSRTTVAYALRNSPKISAQTRELIREAAKKLGYTPDPMLSSLAYYRNHQRRASYQGTLVWLVQKMQGRNTPHWWRDSPHYQSYYEGARRHAPSHGYNIEEHYFDLSSMTLKNIESILYSRNASGILLCPLPTLQVNMHSLWERFPIVTFGYTLIEPELDTVTPAHYANVRFALQKIHQYGYRRIGLMLPRKWDMRANSFVSAAFIASQIDDKGKTTATIKPLFHPDPLDADHPVDYTDLIVSYVRKNRLDAVLTADPSILKTIRSVRHLLPERFGIAGFGAATATPELAGVIENPEPIGTVAVDLLVAKIQRGEHGHSTQPVHSLVRGLWNDGTSLPPLA